MAVVAWLEGSHPASIVLALWVAVVAPAATAVPEPATDFSSPEPGEQYPGGDATHTGSPGRHAFVYPSADLGEERRLDFSVGNALFKRVWVSAPSSTRSADGLGPLYNARSCRECHVGNGRGGLVLQLSIPPQTEADRRGLSDHRTAVVPDPVYGLQLQDRAVQGHEAEGRIVTRYEEMTVTLADGGVVWLRRPEYRIEGAAYGPLHAQLMTSARIAPPIIGLGLLEKISERDILAWADPRDEDGDGVAGRPNRVWGQGQGTVMLGRFGWKAGEPTVDQQAQTAFSRDLGLSVAMFPAGAGECTARQTACRQAPDGGDPRQDGLEAPPPITDLLAFYVRNIAVPYRRDHAEPEVLAGKRIFHRSGCAACHRPTYVIGNDAAGPGDAGQVIWPYTDLLLHDMGDGLADGRPEGEAGGRDWRTAPLWGVGLAPVVNARTGYLHDGRARNLLEAILWHGGEAQKSRDAVITMPAREREQLIRFVASL